MPKVARQQIIPLLFLVLYFLCSVPSQGFAGAVTFKLISERIQDIPIKTQIEQHIVASAIPTKEQIEAEILKRYRAARSRSGFRYHNPPTNIYIYVYGTEEQARAERGLWVGMIAKSYSDVGQPKVMISEARLRALSAPAQNRFGLSQKVRKQVYWQIATAEDRARREAMQRIPNSQIMKQLYQGALRLTHSRCFETRPHGRSSA